MEIKYGIEEPDHTLIITVDWDTQSDVAKKKKKAKMVFHLYLLRALAKTPI